MKPSQSIMNDQHRAMPWQWETIERNHHHAEFSCLLELHDRIKALEAAQHAHVDLSHLSDAEREKMLKSIANPGRFEALEAAATEAQLNHPAKPDSSLVDRVACAIYPDGSGDGFREEAREAIREVAAWLREHYGAPTTTTYLLEQEAKR